MQKTAYEMRISDWSSDVCSSDLASRYVDGRRLHRAGLFAGVAVDVAHPGDRDLIAARVEPAGRRRLQQRLDRRGVDAPRTVALVGPHQAADPPLCTVDEDGGV